MRVGSNSVFSLSRLLGDTVMWCIASVTSSTVAIFGMIAPQERATAGCSSAAAAARETKSRSRLAIILFVSSS